jgi:RecB family exonuclease
MNQDDATIVYDGRSSFLREDRKDRLGIEDRDISAEFIKAYAVSGAFTVFTVADRTFSGPTVPHRKLKELLSGEVEAKDLAALSDSYATEIGLLTAAPVKVCYPSVLQKQGKRGFDILRQKPEARDLRFSAIGDAALRAAIEERLCNQKKFRDQRAGKPAGAPAGEDAPDSTADIAASDSVANIASTAGIAATTGAANASSTAELAGATSIAATAGAPSGTESPHPPDTRAGISPTDLDEYLKCPFMWVLQRGLGVKEKQTEIEMLDQRNIGNLYHNILEEIFNHIQKESGRFRAEDIAIYKESLKKMTTKAIDKAQMREGYFQKPVYDMLRPRIEASLMDYLENDKETINGCEIAGTEYWLQKPCEASCEAPDGAQTKAALDLLGRADLVLKADDGSFVLTDFKTNSMPPPKDIFAQDDADFPKNVQMAAYIAMLETPRRSSGDAAGGETDRGDAPPTVRTARFYSIDGREFRNVVSAEDDKPRSDYDKEVASVDTVIATAAEAMRTGAYMTPKNPPRKDCIACPVSSVCRRPFMGEQSGIKG